MAATEPLQLRAKVQHVISLLERIDAAVIPQPRTRSTWVAVGCCVLGGLHVSFTFFATSSPRGRKTLGGVQCLQCLASVLRIGSLISYFVYLPNNYSFLAC